MSEAAPGYGDVEAFATPGRARLAASVRHLVDAAMSTIDVDDHELESAAARVEAVVQALTGAPLPPPTAAQIGPGTGFDRHLDYLPRSPVIGEASPFAPPFQWEVREGRAVGRATLGAPYEGPPGFVHGGMIAMIFDEILGLANIASGTPGMTGTLTVKYRRPTPLRQPIEVEGWVERAEGRRILARGTMTVDGELTAEAQGVFVSLRPEAAQEYFGREPDA